MLDTVFSARKARMENSQTLILQFWSQKESTVWHMLARGHLCPVLKEARALFVKW